MTVEQSPEDTVRFEGIFYQTITFAIEESSKDQGSEAGTGRAEVRAIRTIFNAAHEYMIQYPDAEFVDPVISNFADDIADVKALVDNILDGRRLEEVSLDLNDIGKLKKALTAIQVQIDDAVANKELLETTIIQIENKLAHNKAGGQCGACAALCLSRKKDGDNPPVLGA